VVRKIQKVIQKIQKVTQKIPKKIQKIIKKVAQKIGKKSPLVFKFGCVLRIIDIFELNLAKNEL
jgi:tetrahydromethanopterin S-methyltransferase subunit G